MKIIDLLNKIANGEIEYEDYLSKDEFYLNKITVKDMLDYELEDDETSTGGLSFAGETLKDFIADDLDDSLDTSIFWINDRLKACGVKEITEKDCKYYFNSKNNWKWKVYGKEHSYNISTPQKIIADKLNEIIKYLDYLKSKGDE